MEISKNIIKLLKLLIDPILKLSDSLRPYPFLTTIVICIFGISFIIVIAELAKKSDGILIVSLVIFLIIAIFFGNLQLKAQNEGINKDKNNIRGLEELKG